LVKAAKAYLRGHQGTLSPEPLLLSLGKKEAKNHNIMSGFQRGMAPLVGLPRGETPWYIITKEAKLNSLSLAS